MTTVPSAFAHIDLAPPVTVFKVRDDYLADPAEKKINLSVGAYRDDNGDPWVLPVVRSVESEMANDPTLNHEYLPITGLPSFCKVATELVLGKDSAAMTENRAAGIQALSGTGALRIAAEFLRRFYRVHEPNPIVCFPDPTWGNHDAIFKYAAFNDRRKYRYWDAKNRCLDLDGMLEDLSNMPEYSIIILHSCAHNPTGIDPTMEQWEKIASACKQRNLFPVFDSAYQGFASGDPDLDAASVRMFERVGFEFFVCQSFSKNFGLYNERVGNLTMVLKDSDSLMRARSQMELIIRGMYSNPPSHGARIVATTLSNPAYYSQWRENIRTMAERIKKLRKLTYEKLKIMGTPGKWDHIVEQIGMFSYTGLSATQCEFLTKQKHVYLLKSGRISMCGLTEANLDHFVQSVHEAVVTITENKL